MSIMQLFVRYQKGKRHVIGTEPSRPSIKRTLETQTAKVELPDKLYPIILCKVKCPLLIRPQRYNCFVHIMSRFPIPVRIDDTIHSNETECGLIIHCVRTFVRLLSVLTKHGLVVPCARHLRC